MEVRAHSTTASSAHRRFDRGVPAPQITDKIVEVTSSLSDFTSIFCDFF